MLTNTTGGHGHAITVAEIKLPLEQHSSYSEWILAHKINSLLSIMNMNYMEYQVEEGLCFMWRSPVTF